MHLAAHRSTPHHCLSGDDFGDDADCDDLDDDDYDHDNDDDDDGKNVTFEHWAVVARKWNIGCRWSLRLILHKLDKGSPTQIHVPGIWAMALPVRASTFARMVWGTFLEKNFPNLNVIFLDNIYIYIYGKITPPIYRM